MKSVVIAIDHTSLGGTSFENFCETLRFFQQMGLFSRASIASVIHASQFAVPFSYYRTHQDELAHEALDKIDRACSGRFQYLKTRIIQSPSQMNEDIVELLSKYGRRIDAEILILGNQDRKGLPYWLLGSVSQTAALTSKMSVLVIKKPITSLELSRQRNIVVGLDVSSPPSLRDVASLSQLANAASAQIHLVYVRPSKRPIIHRLRPRADITEIKRVLEKIKRALDARGVDATVAIVDERSSVAQALMEYAEKKKTMLLVTTTVKRSATRKLLLGSTARNTLALTKRPFLSLR